MPLYDWACEECGVSEQTIVPMSESDVPPPPHKDATETYCAGPWKKVILSPPHARRGENWNGAKGNW